MIISIFDATFRHNWVASRCNSGGSKYLIHSLQRWCELSCWIRFVYKVQNHESYICLKVFHSLGALTFSSGGKTPPENRPLTWSDSKVQVKVLQLNIDTRQSKVIMLFSIESQNSHHAQRILIEQRVYPNSDIKHINTAFTLYSKNMF